MCCGGPEYYGLRVAVSGSGRKGSKASGNTELSLPLAVLLCGWEIGMVKESRKGV